LFDYFFRQYCRYAPEYKHSPEFMDLPDYILFAGAGGDYSDNIFFIVILLDKSIFIG